jgi:hypothetical protein
MKKEGKKRKEENDTVHRHILTSTSIPSQEEQSQVHQ